MSTPAESAQVIIAKGITKALEEANDLSSFASTINTIQRGYGELDLELKIQPQHQRLDIVPHSYEVSLYDRECHGFKVITSVALRKKFSPTITVSGVDDCLALCQQIACYFAPSQPLRNDGLILPASVTGADTARWESCVVEAPYEQYLHQYATFLGIIRISYMIAMIPTL